MTMCDTSSWALCCEIYLTGQVTVPIPFWPYPRSIGQYLRIA